MVNFKRKYIEVSNVVYVAVGVLDRAMPHSRDEEGWAKWEAARSALYEYASQLRAHPYNPVVQEAHSRGDYEYFLKQLERGTEANRKRQGWTKKQVRKAIPIIRKIVEKEKDNGDDPETD